MSVEDSREAGEKPETPNSKPAPKPSLCLVAPRGPHFSRILTALSHISLGALIWPRCALAFGASIFFLLLLFLLPLLDRPCAKILLSQSQHFLLVARVVPFVGFLRHSSVELKCYQPAANMASKVLPSNFLPEGPETPLWSATLEQVPRFPGKAEVAMDPMLPASRELRPTFLRLCMCFQPWWIGAWLFRLWRRLLG